MSKRWGCILITLFCVIFLCGCGKNSTPEDVIIKPDQYPLTKEIVVEAFEKVDLPGIVSEERYDSAIRTSIDIRDEENRLIVGIASNGDGEKMIFHSINEAARTLGCYQGNLSAVINGRIKQTAGFTARKIDNEHKEEHDE